MEARETHISAAGLFAGLKAAIAGLTDRVDRAEREAAFVRGPLSLVLPVPGGRATSRPDP